MQIQAAVARSADSPIVIEKCEIDEPREGEILVKIKAAGVCHTDLAVKLGHLPVTLPRVLGHEGAGIVERVGPGVTRVAAGDHVLMTFGTCGICVNCAEGHPTYCDHFRPINFGGQRTAGPALRCDGVEIGGNFFAQSSFATYALGTERNVIKIDRDVPLDILAPLGCGILTGMGAVLRCLKPFSGSSIAVFGVGSVGLAAIMAAKIVGCTTIVAVDVKESRLKVAREVGATHIVDGSRGDVVEEILKVTGPGAHYSMDTTGVPSVVANSVACLRKRGKTAQVAAPRLGSQYTIDPTVFVSRGITIIGVIEGDVVPWSFLPQMIEFYRKGMLPLEKLVKRFPFGHINEAIAAMEQGTAIKPVLVMG